MPEIRHDSPFWRRSPRKPLLATVLVAGMLIVGSTHAAKFGHSRLISAMGEPLRIAIPVTQLNAADAASLRVIPAPVSEWSDTGLTPPVELSTLQTRLIDGQAVGSRVIQVWSDQIFDKSIADLLLDIHTSSGIQRYQVSLLARGGAGAVQAPATSKGASAGPNRSAVSASASFLAQKPVLIRRGDTMFSVARRHAVSGVSVYQMMIALLRANPHAFIHHNLNLVRAGEQLSMPDMAALTAISDREARRLFHEQVVAFGLLQRSLGDRVSDDVAAIQPVTQDARDSALTETASNVPESRVGAGDQLKLSVGRATTASGSNEAVAGNSISAQSPTTGRQVQPSGTQAGETAQSAASVMAPIAHAATTTTVVTPTPGTNQKNDVAAPTNAAGTTGTPAVLSASTTTGSSATTQDAVPTPQGGSAAAQDTSSTGAVDSDTGKPDDGKPESGAAASRGDQTSMNGTAAASVQPANSAQPSVGASAPVTTASKGGLTDDDGTQADDELATRKAIDDAQQRVSQLEENVKNLNRALQSQGEAAKDLIVEGAIGLRQSLTDVATAVTDATIGDEELIDTLVESAKMDDASSKAKTSPSEPRLTNKASTMDSMIAWVQGHLLAVITAVLAFIVLVVAWGLRRANVAQSSSDSAITPEMVKEKLEQINLDLNEPTVDDPLSSRP